MLALLLILSHLLRAGLLTGGLTAVAAVGHALLLGLLRLVQGVLSLLLLLALALLLLALLALLTGLLLPGLRGVKLGVELIQRLRKHLALHLSER